jgi:hypothetical protein
MDDDHSDIGDNTTNIIVMYMRITMRIMMVMMIIIYLLHFCFKNIMRP